jgi:hypothetical protein
MGQPHTGDGPEMLQSEEIAEEDRTQHTTDPPYPTPIKNMAAYRVHTPLAARRPKMPRASKPRQAIG